MSPDSVINITGTYTPLSKQKIIKALVIVAVITLFINCIFYTYHNANPLVKSDGWRFIEIYLTPWYNGELNWLDLWRDHHPQPLTAILFIINANYFDLRMDYESLFSVTFSLLSLIVLWRAFNLSTHKSEWLFGKYIFILLSTALLCSLTSTVIYTWSLVTQGYIFIFFALLILLSIERLSRTKINFYRFWLHTLYITLLFIAFGDGAKILVYSCFAVTFLSFLLDRDIKWLPPLLSIVLAIILQFIFLNIIDFNTKYSEMSVASAAIEKTQYLPEYFLYIGTGLLSAWVNIGSLTKKMGGEYIFIYIISSIIFITYIYTLYIYFKNKLYSNSIIPGTLIVTSFLTGLGAAIFRFNPDTQTALAGYMPRYYLLYVLGAIGTIWIWCMLLQNTNISKRTRVASYFIISIILVSQVLSSIAAWNTMPYRKKAFTNSFNIMVDNANGDLSIKPPIFMIGHNYPEPYLTGLAFLKEHKLNVFCDENIIEKHQK